MICWFKQEECSQLMPESLVYSKSVIECLLHCLLISRGISVMLSFMSQPASTQAEKLWYCSFCFMCSIAMPYLLIKTSSPL